MSMASPTLRSSSSTEPDTEAESEGIDPPQEQISGDRYYWQEEQAELETGPVYPYRHAVALQQKRRMRSKEIHYIDHPMLGIIIKFTPLIAPEPTEVSGLH